MKHSALFAYSAVRLLLALEVLDVHGHVFGSKLMSAFTQGPLRQSYTQAFPVPEVGSLHATYSGMPNSCEVQISVKVSSVNPSDRFPTVAQSLLPHVLGSDVAGEVVAAEPGCTNLNVGDRVWGDIGANTFAADGSKTKQLGGYGQYAVALESQLWQIPLQMSYQEAGAGCNSTHKVRTVPSEADLSVTMDSGMGFCIKKLTSWGTVLRGKSRGCSIAGGGGGPFHPDGLFAQQEQEPIRGRPTVRGKRTYGGRPGQRVEEQGTWASRTQKHSEAGYGRPVDRGAWTAKTVKRPRQQPAHPQYANYWAPLTRKRHTMPQPAQPRHTNYWAPRTRKRHQQEHRPQRPTEHSDPTQHAKGRTGDRPGPRKGATTRRNVTQGGPFPQILAKGA